jgi:hypothetical protein
MSEHEYRAANQWGSTGSGGETGQNGAGPKEGHPATAGESIQSHPAASGPAGPHAPAGLGMNHGAIHAGQPGPDQAMGMGSGSGGTLHGGFPGHRPGVAGPSSEGTGVSGDPRAGTGAEAYTSPGCQGGYGMGPAPEAGGYAHAMPHAGMGHAPIPGAPHPGMVYGHAHGMAPPGMAYGPNPGMPPHPAYYGVPHPGGHAGSGMHAGPGGGPGMAQVLEEMANGAGLSKLNQLLNFDDKEFWKGALIGAAAVLLLTNESVQKALFRTGAKAKEAVKSGVEKVSKTASEAQEKAPAGQPGDH